RAAGRADCGEPTAARRDPADLTELGGKVLVSQASLDEPTGSTAGQLRGVGWQAARYRDLLKYSMGEQAASNPTFISVGGFQEARLSDLRGWSGAARDLRTNWPKV